MDLGPRRRRRRRPRDARPGLRAANPSQRNVIVAVAAVAGVTMLDAVCAQGLSRQRRTRAATGAGCKRETTATGAACPAHRKPCAALRET